MTIVAPLALGFAFGWLLQRTGLTRYDRIANIYRFRDLTVLKFLLSALATAAIGIQTLDALGVATAIPVPPTYALGNFGGGVVFGIGMALAGFCPGTVAAGAGEGRLDSLVPGGLGLVAGALIFGLSYDRVMPVLARGVSATPPTLAAMLDVEPWLLAVVFAELTIIGFYALERARRSTARTDHSAASASDASAPTTGSYARGDAR